MSKCTWFRKHKWTEVKFTNGIRFWCCDRCGQHMQTASQKILSAVSLKGSKETEEAR